MKRLNALLIVVGLVVGMIGCQPVPAVQYQLTISSTEGGSVTTPGEGTFTYEEGTSVNLVAVPASGYSFGGWTGDVITIANVHAALTTITMNGNYSIAANFQVIPSAKYSLTISSGAGGWVAAPGEGIFRYEEGAVVDIVATADAGHVFVNWAGDVSAIHDVYCAVTTITMNEDFSISASFIEDEVVGFADPNLEAAVRDTIGIPQGPIYGRDMEVLCELRAASRSISDLTGLEYATHLTFLELNNNQISDILPLAGLTGLTWLQLTGNNIGDISPLAGLTNLWWLALSWNEISDISPLASVTGLSLVYLDSNQISDISALASLTGLMQLYLSGNQISDISPLAGLTGLTTLYLWGNQISDISPLAGLTSLTSLDLGNNQISDISPLAGLTSLGGLNLVSNQISDILPLVENPGIGAGDWVVLRLNPLSAASISTYIPELEARGVTVITD